MQSRHKQLKEENPWRLKLMVHMLVQWHQTSPWQDRMVRSACQDYVGKQNVVLYFMREFSCAFCQKHVAQLKQLYSTLQAHHAEVLVIGGGSRAEAEQLATHLHVPFPVLADADRGVYHRYGLEKVLSLQRSGIIVVDRQGRVSYSHPT